MGMRKFHLTACCVALVAGCGQPSTTRPNGEEALGPGRFPHSVIQETIAPWDGPATQIFLSEKPLDEDNPAEPRVSIRVYKGPSGLSNQRLRLAGKESREGLAVWIDREGRSTPLSAAAIEVEEVVDRAPVTGKYEVTFPDGKQERGRFKATWWRAEGRGG
jgi:hypothetical protein